jgi:predicted nucleic acid-binding protein
VKFLVDTSVWSLALRRNRPAEAPELEKLRTILEAGDDVLLLGVIFLEILQGIRDRKQFNAVKGRLEAFPLLEPTREDYVHCAHIRNECASRGVHASTVDFLIAGMAIRQDARLLTTDSDFFHISKIVPLKLA